VVGATPIFWPLMRHERGQGRTGLRTPCPPLFQGRSHPSDPWREGFSDEDLRTSHSRQPGLDGRRSARVARSLAGPGRGRLTRSGAGHRSGHACPYCLRLRCHHPPRLSDCQSGYPLHLAHMYGPPVSNRMSLTSWGELAGQAGHSKKTNLSPLWSVRSTTPTRFGRLVGLNGW